MVLAFNKTLATRLYGEIKAFFHDNVVEYFVSYYNYHQLEAYVLSSDTFNKKDASVNEYIEQMLLFATKALMERRDIIVVASVPLSMFLGILALSENDAAPDAQHDCLPAQHC